MISFGEDATFAELIEAEKLTGMKQDGRQSTKGRALNVRS